MPRQRRGVYRQPTDEERRAIIDAHRWAIRTVCGSRGKNVSFITAISDRHEHGIIYHDIVDGGVSNQRFVRPR